MAIRLTDTLETTEGSTSTLYFHICTITISEKDGSVAQTDVKYFTNEDKVTPCALTEKIDKIKTAYVLDISANIDDDTKIKKLIYDAIAAELLAAGLSPESDESGSWVAYT